MRFDGAVVLDPGAFQLIRHGTNQVVNTIATQTQLPGGQVQVAITFSGSATRGAGLLVDGYYELTIDGSKILRTGQGLDINGDGVGGDTQVIGSVEADNFFALYGDTDGDGIVGVAEFGSSDRRLASSRATRASTISSIMKAMVSWGSATSANSAHVSANLSHSSRSVSDLTTIE